MDAFGKFKYENTTGLTLEEMFELYLEIYGWDTDDPPIQYGIRPDTPNAIFIEFKSGEKVCFSLDDSEEVSEDA